jgi:hypothetical protein
LGEHVIVKLGSFRTNYQFFGRNYQAPSPGALYLGFEPVGVHADLDYARVISAKGQNMPNEFSQIEFADNPEPRCPCLLLLDTSGSMAGRPIEQLNAGLSTLHSELNADSLASKRVDLAIVTFGPVRVEAEFTSA